MVSQGLEIAVVVVFSVLFEMDDGSLLLLFSFHRYQR